MNLENEHNKQQPFGVPSDYFETFQDALDARLAEERLREVVKGHGFALPETYFKEFEFSSEEQLASNEVKVFSLFNTKTIATVAAIAACLVLVFTIFNNNPSNQEFALEDIETTTLDEYLDSDAITFTDSELTAYLNEETISLEATIEGDIANEALEDYILDNLDANDIYIQYEE
ncbi:MAG: hypothetical protein ABJM06_02685 [Gilvibacter sp.]